MSQTRYALIIRAVQIYFINSMHPSFSKDDFPIDAVITWVDGEDPIHRAKLNQHLVEIGSTPRGASRSRLNSSGEIDYCIRLILKFAPFLRRIFVVTDNQTPPILQNIEKLSPFNREKLVLVDHRQIFPEEIDCLPTFNSLSIETVLHRIPGLSEHFVYFNDDVFLINPVSRDDWFHNGKPVIRGIWRAQKRLCIQNFLKKCIFQNPSGTSRPMTGGYNAAQIASAKLAGFENEYLCIHHTPFPMRKSTIEAFYFLNPGVMKRNISFRFRNSVQFLPQSLAIHIELKKGAVKLQEDYQLLYIKPPTNKNWLLFKLKLFFLTIRFRRTKFACIQNLESTTQKNRILVFGWLDKIAA